MVSKKLHPGAKWLFRVKGFFGAFFFVVFFSIFVGQFIFRFLGIENFISSFVAVIIVGIVLLIILAEIYARLSYRFWSYEFTDSQLRIERGIIWKKYSNIPYERIQSVDITRGVIARLCGFSTVNIQTAGYSLPAGRGAGAGSEGYIPAVPIDEAEKIREFVVGKITKRGRKQGL